MMNYKHRLSIIFTVLLVGITSSGCTQSSTSDVYVDLDTAESTIDPEYLNIQVSNFTYDSKSYCNMRYHSTIDADYYYNFNVGNYKIDLKSGRCFHVCEIPGCAHSENTAGCLDYQFMFSPVATEKGIYFVKDNQVMLLHEGRQDVVVQNHYYSEYEKDAYPNQKSLLSAITICDNIMYIIGPTYYFTYNLLTQERTESQQISSSLIISFVATTKDIYFATDSLELFHFSIPTQSISKIDDKVSQVCVSDNKVYYIRYKDEIPYLCTLELNGNGMTELIQDCWVNYCVAGEYVYYQSFDENRSIHICKLDGSQSQDIELICDNRNFNSGATIISSDSIDHVLMVDWDNKILFSFEKGKTDYKALKFGEG